MDAPLAGATAPWASWALDPRAAAVPTMLTAEEGRMLAWVAAQAAIPATVIDLGCFAGGSTARLASGLRGGRVVAFDHFTIAEAHKAKFLYPAGVAPFAGSDLLPTARALLAPWADRVTLVPGDICAAHWRDPIDVLFVDAAKSPATADALAATFFPHLRPGAVLIQQDYQHWRQPWVPVQMELLAGCFALVGWTAENSVLWRCVRAPTDADLVAARVAPLDDAALTADLVRALDRFGGHGAPAQAPRTALGRAILGLADNPGQRNPTDFDRSRFTPARLRAVLARPPAG